MSGFGIQRIGSSGFRVAGSWAGGWLAERDLREVLGRRFIKEASVPVSIGMPGSVSAGVVQRSTG
jgi:hypothetical protein